MLIPFGILGAAGAGIAGSYEQIATAVVTGTAATITFSGIPQTYRHLQLRYGVRSGSSSTTLGLEFNGITGFNNQSYSQHRITGFMTSVMSEGLGTRDNINLGFIPTGAGTSFGAGIADILDYTSTTNNKTARSLSGRVERDSNAGNTDCDVTLYSGHLRNTGAVTSMRLFSVQGESLTVGSKISLYGIKGA